MAKRTMIAKHKKGNELPPQSARMSICSPIILGDELATSIAPTRP
jgi:hypothetical protein